MRRIIFLTLALASAAAIGETYRWVDPVSGMKMFSDTPPPGTAKQKIRKADEGEDNPASFAVRRAAEYFPVTLYTSPDCIAECRQARDLLNSRGVPFSEKMVQKPEEVAELKQLLGDTYVPTLKVGRQPVRGFQAESYNNLLDLAGYPKTAPIGSKPSGGLTASIKP